MNLDCLNISFSSIVCQLLFSSVDTISSLQVLHIYIYICFFFKTQKWSSSHIHLACCLYHHILLTILLIDYSSNSWFASSFVTSRSPDNLIMFLYFVSHTTSSSELLSIYIYIEPMYMLYAQLTTCFLRIKSSERCMRKSTSARQLHRCQILTSTYL